MPKEDQRSGAWRVAHKTTKGVPCGAQGLLAEQSIAPTTPVAQLYASQVAGKDANLAGVTALDQCITEQAYVRDSITRSLIYNQARSQTPPLLVPYIWACLALNPLPSLALLLR